MHSLPVIKVLILLLTLHLFVTFPSHAEPRKLEAEEVTTLPSGVKVKLGKLRKIQGKFISLLIQKDYEYSQKMLCYSTVQECQDYKSSPSIIIENKRFFLDDKGEVWIETLKEDS